MTEELCLMLKGSVNLKKKILDRSLFLLAYLMKSINSLQSEHSN